MGIVRLVLMSSVPLLAVTAVAVAQSAGATTVRAGEADGANTVFVFDERPQTIVLRTARVGVAGSRIEVTVDAVKKPVLNHVFAAAECKFGDGGSVCEVIIPAKDPAYRAILTHFKRGRLARVTMQDAGVMKMDQTVSLSGFAHALR
jgi:hypothetical protein